ncbi:MAG: hypothetical protein RLZZ326_3556 [Planctomycetota bacterium]
MNRRNTKKPPRASALRTVIERLESRAMLASVGPESWSAPGLVPAPLGTGSLSSGGIILTCSSPAPGSSGTASPPAPAAGTGTTFGGDLWDSYRAGSGASFSSSGASGGSSSNLLTLLTQYTEGSSPGGQGNGTGGSLSNADLWRLYWSGAGAGSSSGPANGFLANDPTISAKYTGGAGGGMVFFVTGATGADAAGSGSPQGTTGSTAVTLADGQSTTPLVYQLGSDDGPGVVMAVWTGSEGAVQFMPVADEEVQAASPPEYSGPTIQAAPPWYISAWYTFFGRLASDQPLISDPRGSKSFETGGRTYTVPNYVHDDTFYWIAGNLYHRPLIGDVIGTAELPFRILANPGRFAHATVDGAVGTITNIPRLPEIWSDMPDYQRQDWVIRMLAIPYLWQVGKGLAGARSGTTPPSTRSPADILTPDGQPLGRPGASPGIRRMNGGLAGAERVFAELAAGAKDVTPPGYPGKLFELPNGGRVGLRPISSSADKSPSIDVNIPDNPVRKVHFEL